MDYHFYTFDWLQDKGKGKDVYGSGMFYTRYMPLNSNEIKRYVREFIVKDLSATIQIDREYEIDQLMYEILTGNPFKPGNAQYQ